jgi:hypothetical protein
MDRQEAQVTASRQDTSVDAARSWGDDWLDHKQTDARHMLFSKGVYSLKRKPQSGDAHLCVTTPSPQAHVCLHDFNSSSSPPWYFFFSHVCPMPSEDSCCMLSRVVLSLIARRRTSLAAIAR